MRRTFLAAGATVLLTAAATPTPLIAQVAQTFRACRVPDVGAIYMIGLTGAPESCLDESHVEFSWTEGGAPGEGSVTTASLADGAVTGPKLADGAVDAAKLAEGALDGVTVADGSIDASKLAPDAVTAAAIADGAVTGMKIADGAVDASKLAEGALDGVTVADGSIDAPKLAADAVTAAAVADGAIGAPELATDAVTANALAPDAVTADALAPGAVGPAHLAPDAVTAEALADGIVASQHIVDGGITTPDLAANAVQTDAIQNGAVTASKLGTLEDLLLLRTAGGTSSNGLEIRNTSPTGRARIDFTDSALSQIAFIQVSNQSPSQMSIANNRPNAYVSISTAGQIRMAVRANGNVGIGASNPGNILTIRQNSTTDPIADAWTTYSSGRWKTDVETISDPVGLVRRLRGVRYAWIDDGRRDIGLIAEEVGAVIPEIVHFEENGVDARSVDYARLVAVLIEAVKEQQRQIDGLRNELAGLATAR